MDIFSHHKGGFWTPAHKRSLYLGIVLLLLSVIIQLGAGRYSSAQAATAGYARDLFLDNLPVVNLTPFLVAGAIVFLWAIPAVLLILRPRYLLFGMKAIALFIIFRAFFISLTHIGVYPAGFSPGSNNMGYDFYKLTTFQGNLFFSGHTGFPFLIALIFWDNNFLRRSYLILTVAFAAAVLLAHVHYSIDVFAAPFIVYGVFVITAKLFPRDYALFPHEPPRSTLAAAGSNGEDS